MRIALSFSLFCLFSMTTALAQNSFDEEFSSLPDTFHTYHPKTFFVVDLDAIGGKIVDTLNNPTAYIIDSFKSGGGYATRIALKQKRGHLVFDPFEASLAFAMTSGLSFDRVDFNGKGSDELIIRWDFRTGHSSWQSGVYTSETGYQIWDLDNIQRYIDLITSGSLEQWWAEYDQDSTDMEGEPVLIDSGNHYECFQLEVKLEKKRVIINDVDCETEEPQEGKQDQMNSRVYQLGKNGLIIRH